MKELVGDAYFSLLRAPFFQLGIFDKSLRQQLSDRSSAHDSERSVHFDRTVNRQLV